MHNANYCLIGAAVDKEKHIKKYGKGAKDPYTLSLTFILERLVFYLDNVDRTATVNIFAEERGKKREDRMLLNHFNSVMDRGTYYVPPERLRQRIQGLKFNSKRDNIIGLQIADLCAYPMARHLLQPAEPYIPFQVIKSKIYSDKKGKYLGWGLKTFP